MKNVDPYDVSLRVAEGHELPLLANLLELYQHDLSEYFPVDPGPDGRFGYAKLPLYWSEPDRRFPLLIVRGGKVIGFVLVTRGSPASDDPNVYDVAEFFVLRRYRRSGVGRDAARLLWDRYRGRWFVRVLARNARALAFWRQVIGEPRREVTADGWQVFSFDTHG